MTCPVSVLMSVHNGEAYLEQAVESILAQTFREFEFVIINDASTDNTPSILSGYARDDKRIRVIDNEQNLGLTRSLNKGLSAASGRYIARMDADDISFRKRLTKQFDWMENNPDIGVCGSWIKDSLHNRTRRYPTEHDEIICRMLFNNALAHPSVMIRKSVLDTNGLSYNERFKSAQDYDLWSRCAQHTRLHNLPEPLVWLRQHVDRISRVSMDAQRRVSSEIRKANLENFGLPATEEQLRLHGIISDYAVSSMDELERSEKWLTYLSELRFNENYRPGCMKKTISRVWFELCYNASFLGIEPFSKFIRSPLYSNETANLRDISIFLAKCITRRKTFIHEI